MQISRPLRFVPPLRLLSPLLAAQPCRRSLAVATLVPSRLLRSKVEATGGLEDGDTQPSAYKEPVPPTITPQPAENKEPAPPAKAASVRPVPAEARDPRVKWSALFWTFALLCALVYGGQLGWVFYPGIALDDSGWRLLLQQKLFPFFLGLFATAGMPPQVAAERAAAAAAARSATISYYEAFVAIGGTFLLLLAFCFKSWWKYYWRF